LLLLCERRGHRVHRLLLLLLHGRRIYRPAPLVLGLLMLCLVRLLLLHQELLVLLEHVWAVCWLRRTHHGHLSRWMWVLGPSPHAVCAGHPLTWMWLLLHILVRLALGAHTPSHHAEMAASTAIHRRRHSTLLLLLLLLSHHGVEGVLLLSIRLLVLMLLLLVVLQL
jgi:hypothetical protein